MPHFTLPPADGSLSLLQTFDFHATTNPDHPLFVYESAAPGDGHITWRQAVNMFDTTAQHVRRLLGGSTTVDCTPPPVVGILAATGAPPTLALESFHHIYIYIYSQALSSTPPYFSAPCAQVALHSLCQRETPTSPSRTSSLNPV
jgi:hypothetical protein